MAKVVVGLSGGVDSAVAAYLLKQAGHEVTGVTLRTWESSDGEEGRCCEIDDARSVAAALDIPYHVFNCLSDFSGQVIAPFIREYLRGRTPNPCVVCNRAVKWERMLYAAHVLQADLVATGHYASVVRLPGGRHTVRKALHAEKDQTYMLYRLTQEQLAATLMPLGELSKAEVRQIAAQIKESTGKEVHVTDVRLLLFNPIDLRGIPTSNADKTLAVWLRPQIFQMDPSEDVVNILFLDEISAAPQSVQAAAYQITLDRVVGEHRLPENCIVIAAGNRTTDKSVAFKMPKALANRLMHIEIEGSFRSWKEWAIRAGVNEKVIGFLSFRQNYLMEFDPGSEDLAFPTPRAWEMDSNLLNGISDDIDEMYAMISGIVGSGVDVEFRTWNRVYRDLPLIEDIFRGKMPPMPQSTDAMYALTAAMTSYARSHKDDLNGIANSIRYADRMPADFSTVLLRDYMFIEKDYKLKLMRIPEFSRWLQSKGSLMNGSVQ